MATPVVIAIASANRGGILDQTLSVLRDMEDQPDGICVCLPDSSVGTGDTPDFGADVRVLTSPMGLCAQRNTVIAALPQDAIVLFLDDDFLLGDGSVSAVRKLFDDRPDVAVATGRVLADGIGGPGLTHDEGLSILNQAPPAAGVMTDTYNAYGCNMAIRVATASENDLWFDTDLPFYGWLEDVDMSRKLAAHGAVVKIDGLYGVHLGTKKGRSRGVPLGYSQIANPLYLVKRGTMSRRKAYRLMGRNILANVARTPRPEAWIDRFGRLRGNILAFVDLLRGRMSPTRIRDL